MRVRFFLRHQQTALSDFHSPAVDGHAKTRALKEAKSIVVPCRERESLREGEA